MILFCLHGLVHFSSSLSLPSVAALISKHLFGGLQFVYTEEFDEIPGMRLEKTVLMLHICVYGKSPDFVLRFDTTADLFMQTVFPELEHIYLSKYVEEALSSLEQISINSV